MATAITPAQAELISSLSQDEIPIKLRCAICRRLAVNAFRLLCCDQAICETCQSALPESCPVCEHSPVAAEDCKPNKALRTTIKVFLRTEEKKREAIRLKEAKNSPAATQAPVIAAPTPAPVEAPLPPRAEVADVQIEEPLAVKEPSPILVQGQSTEVVENTAVKNGTGRESAEAGQDVPQPSIEEITADQVPTEGDDANNAEDGAEDGDRKTVEKDENGQAVAERPSGSGSGFDSTAAMGGFASMGGVDPMQNMMLMQQMMGGMAPNAFSNFPMMGNMGMDPMAMQNMMGGFGAGMGMGMNGMNMGMGNMGGFAGNGSGFNNGWNQQSWNVGQDNYNHPNASGMGQGDYGSHNSGFPHSTGYNQGNYSGNQYNGYQNQTGYYNNRGRGGRGRGGFGNDRGGYGHGSNNSFSQQQYPQQKVSYGPQANGPNSETGSSIPAGPKADVASADVDEFGREIRHVSEAKDVTQDDEATAPSGDKVPIEENGTAKDTETSGLNEDAEVAPSLDEGAPRPIQTLDEAENAYHNNYGNYGNYNGGFDSRGNAMQPPLVKPVDVPINAPTGPKAMREGLPNTGISGLRLSNAGRATSIPVVNGNASANATVAPERISDSKAEDRERSRSPEKDRSRDRKRSRSRHRNHRHRSASLSEDDKETERRRQRRKERRDDPDDRHRRRESRMDEHDEVRAESKEERKESKDDRKSERREDREKDDRSRSASPSESRRSSHRSRHESRHEKDKYRERDRDDRDRYRDRDRDKERERDRDRDEDGSHKHRSSRRDRHHDERSRSRDGHERTRDREHRSTHPSRRSSQAVTEEKQEKPLKADDKGSSAKNESSLPPTPIEEAPPRRPSTIHNGNAGGRGLFEIKGASTRNLKPLADLIIPPTGPKSQRDGPSSARDRDSAREREPRSAMSNSNANSRGKDKPRERGDDRYRHKESLSAHPENDRDRKRSSDVVGSAPAVQDPHTLEREARNRERLLKEAQRIAGLAGGGAVGLKRSRDDGDDGRKGGRTKKRGHESDEARISRLEAEREGLRWAT